MPRQARGPIRPCKVPLAYCQAGVKASVNLINLIERNLRNSVPSTQAGIILFNLLDIIARDLKTVFLLWLRAEALVPPADLIISDKRAQAVLAVVSILACGKCCLIYFFPWAIACGYEKIFSIFRDVSSHQLL